ncbi:putative tectonin beta-propeller repeat-containing protein 2-like [Ditylenchus destructor]|uniref:Tectonin beta-propeller repeat-containing protein 2-like n=1 Tax=Ditylenchus destructor TaxID=166010 RepID=A0AAD4MSP0_9BILA|nr:putative tectonin beta-propeller repeat-containing protein 2-like [Ditylenchus destructor]
MSTVPIYSVVDEEEMEKSEEEKPSGRVLFNSLSSAAAKSSRHLFSKIEELQNSQVATAGMQMMDNFLLGSAVGVNGKKEPSLSSEPIINQMENVSENEKEENDWTSARLGFSIPTGFGLLSEERRTNIVSNFRNIYDNLKVSNLMTDYNHNPLSAEQRHETPLFYKDYDQGEFASTSSTAGDSSFFGEHDVNSEERISERGKFPSTLSENIKVNVSRKSRAKRIRLPEINSAKLKSGDGLNNFYDKSEETAQEQNDRLRREISSSPQCENPGIGAVGLPLGDINLDRILRVINQTDDAEISPFCHDSNSNATETEYQLAHSDDSSSASEQGMTSCKSLVDTEYEDNHKIEFKDDEVSSLSVSILPLELRDIMIESRMAEQHERKDEVVAETPDEMVVASEMIHEASTSTQNKEFTTSDHNEVSPRSATNSLADDTELIMDSIDEAVIAQPYMCHLNKGGYEIHSTTPSCSSSANDSSLERNNADYLIISGLVNHRTDIWTQLIAPYQICSMDICENYIAICPSTASGGLFSLQKRPRPLYRLLNTVDNGVMGGSWMQVKISGGLPTMSLAVNDSGNILWRIDSSGFAYSPVTTDPFSPVPSDNTWIGQTGEEGAITSVALTTKNAWYSTKKGVYVQLNLPEMGILFRTECPFELTKLAASDQAVWALRSDTGNLVVRIGLQHCPMGVDWVEDNLSGLPRKFVSIALYGQFGFGLDSAGNLFMINGVTESTPFGQFTDLLLPTTHDVYGRILDQCQKLQETG